jgi:N-formylglutamate amidohydrolase
MARLQFSFTIFFRGDSCRVPREFCPRGVEPVQIFDSMGGTLPIIFSAPHGGRQPVAGANVRRGVGVAQFATGRDHNTDELAETIAAKLEVRLGAKPFLLVGNFERKYFDLNRPPERAYESAHAKFYYDAYHSALREAHDRVRRQWGSGLLLDIWSKRSG